MTSEAIVSILGSFKSETFGIFVRRASNGMDGRNKLSNVLRCVFFSRS